MVKTTITVPTYNQSEYLPICLDSLVFQDAEDVEILIVNDGSTDDTAAVIDSYLEGLEQDTTRYVTRYDEETDDIVRTVIPRFPGDKQFRVITHETNKGLAAALNTGAREAAGEYVTYVPSDNICYPGFIADLVEPLDAGHDFAYSDMLIVNDAGRILRRFALPDYSVGNCFGDWYFCGVSKLYRKSLHDRFGYYREDLLAHDHELFQRFALGGASFHHVTRPLMGVRDHGEASRQVDIHSPDNWNRLLRESCDLVRQAREHLCGGKA